MSGEPDGDRPTVLTDQDEPEQSPAAPADERFARGEAFMTHYRTTFEMLAKQGRAADQDVIRQVELGNEIMEAYGETFSALAKPP
jgi:hypothetical protein